MLTCLIESVRCKLLPV